MITEPLVSIVTPVFNGERFVAEAIESVLAQSHENLEHLVVDDGSLDGTCKIVEQYQTRDSRVRLLRNIFAKGAVGARNTAIDVARGRYIAFLDSDDVWYEHKLRKQIAMFRETAGALVFSSYDFRREDGSSMSKTRLAPPEVTYRALLGRNFIGCLTAMFDTTSVGKPFMPNIRMRQDWGLWLRILRETGTSAVGIREPLAALRVRRDSLSRNKLVAAWYNYQLLHRHEGLGVIPAAAKVAESSIRALCGQ